MALTFRWLGHSGFLFTTEVTQFILDPFLSGNQLAPMGVDGVPESISHILITHAHGDHVGDADEVAGDTLAIARRTGATLVSNFEIGNWFASNGIDNVWGGNPGGMLQADGFSVKFTKAFHSSSFSDGSYGGQPMGMIIRAGGITAYHAGDTSLFGDMALIGDEGIDIAFLPIGDRFTMGVEDSIKAVQLIKPKYVFPMHYNTFPPIVQDAKSWANRINRETDAQPIIIDPGNEYTLNA